MPVTDTRKLYEAYPHLVKIEELWGTRQGREFINSLITDTRGGQRHGFPPEHATTIVSLLIEHDREFPRFDIPAGSWWIVEQACRERPEDGPQPD